MKHKLSVDKMLKKGQSVIVGYVLLIVIAVTMSFIVYNYLKSYVPQEGRECPSDVSLILRSYENNCEDGELILELENKGLFNISAYSARTSREKDREIGDVLLTGQGKISYDRFPDPLAPGKRINLKISYFEKGNIVKGQKIEFIEITPHLIENRKSTVCTNAQIKEELKCSEVCNLVGDQDGDGLEDKDDPFCNRKPCDNVNPSKIWVNGECKYECIDTDITPQYLDGQNPFIKGTTTGRDSQGNPKIFTDNCYLNSPYTVEEGYCLGSGEFQSKLIDCGDYNGVCLDGICVTS